MKKTATHVNRWESRREERNWNFSEAFLLERVTEEIHNNLYFWKPYWRLLQGEPYSDLTSVSSVLKEITMKKDRSVRRAENILQSLCLYTLWSFKLICVAQYCQHSAVTSEFRIFHQDRCSGVPAEWTRPAAHNQEQQQLHCYLHTL
jgi:hypothetical protein